MRNLCTALLETGRITTTEAKAKELRRWVERLITAAKPQDVNARRHVSAEIGPNSTLVFEVELLKVN